MLALAANFSAQNTTQMMNEMLQPYEFSSHSLMLKEGKLSYIKEGHGQPVLVFIHGLSSNGDAWFRNIKDLKNDFTCYAVDLPGYGRSYKEAEAFTPTYFAEVVKEFADKLSLKDVVLVGHSMGGQTAIKLAALYPDFVKKVVLVAPAGIEEFNEDEAKALKTFTTKDNVMRTLPEQIEKNYQMNFFKMPSEAYKMIKDRLNIIKAKDFEAHALAIEKSVAGMLDDKVIADLEKVKQPVLLLFAEDDRLIPNRFLHPTLSIQEVANKAQKTLSNSLLKMIPESGHFLQFEKPAEVNKAIREFVKEK